MAELTDFKVACLATDGVEEIELESPVKALRDAGARVDIISPDGKDIQGFKHHDKKARIRADRSLEQARSDDYDALLLPGGALNADALRIVPRAQEFAREIANAGKPIAVICHGPWLLVSSGLVQGRTITSWPTLRDDLRNAGANWVDQEVVVDRKLVSSRKPDDLPAFNRELIRVFEESAKRAAA